MNFKKKLAPFKPFLYSNQLPIFRWNLLLGMEKGKFDQETHIDGFTTYSQVSI